MFPYVLDTNSMLNQEKGGDEVQRGASGAWYDCLCCRGDHYGCELDH
jgi:hypothetical protein